MFFTLPVIGSTIDSTRLGFLWFLKGGNDSVLKFHPLAAFTADLAKITKSLCESVSGEEMPALTSSFLKNAMIRSKMDNFSLALFSIRYAATSLQ